MKPLHYKKFLIIGFIVITVLGIFLPGILLHATFSSKLDSVNTVSADLYNTSNSAISRNASQKLSEYERIKLISGAWDSTMTEVDSSLLNISDVEAVELARTAISKLYEAGAYPYQFDSFYDNWYSWETHCYQCTENSFHTYSAYFWKVSFYHYDTNEIHEVLITENGTLLAVRNNQTNDTLDQLSGSWNTTMKKYFENQYPSTASIAFFENKEEYDNEGHKLPTYEVLDLKNFTPGYSSLLVLNNPSITNYSDFEKMVSGQIPDSTEVYLVYRYSNYEYFLICFIPWE